MKPRLALLLVAVLLTAVVADAKRKKDSPPGVIAASAGEAVVLADPDGGWRLELDTGTVGWLYPAPSAIVFAPDLIRGSTTVLDLRGRRIMDRFEGVTTPHFGSSPDRYVVIADELLMISYPDRAVISRIPLEVSNPWQVISTNKDTVVLVLDRTPENSSETDLVAVDLIGKRVVYRRKLTGDVRHIALSTGLGLLALADATARAVQLFNPANLAPVAALPVVGNCADVAFMPDGKTLVAASFDSLGGGEVRMWTVKSKDGELKVKREHHVALTSPPLRLAVSPMGDLRAAVGVEGERVDVVDFGSQSVVGSIGLPEAPRDVVWVDTLAEGPMVPQWTDESPDEIEIGHRRR